MIYLVLTSFSLGVSLVNTAAMIMMYIRYIKSFHGAICSVRASDDGDIEIIDLV